MTTSTAPTTILRMSQPVLAAYASVLAMVVGGALGVGIAGLASAAGVAEHSQTSHIASSESQTH